MNTASNHSSSTKLSIKSSNVFNTYTPKTSSIVMSNLKIYYLTQIMEYSKYVILDLLDLCQKKIMISLNMLPHAGIVVPSYLLASRMEKHRICGLLDV